MCITLEDRKCSEKMSDIRKFMKDRNNIADERDDEKSLEKKLKRHKRGKISKVLFLLVVLVAAAVAYTIYNCNRVYTEYEVISSVGINDTYNSRFYGFGEYVLRYSEDGLAYLNGEKTYWNQAFEMREPIIDVCDGYVAIADKRTNVVYICNTESLQGKIETEYPIVGLDVSAGGIVAAITEEDSDVSHIEMIGKDGTKIAKGQTVLSGEGCPVDLSVSKDGSKLVVSYLYVGSGIIQSKVVFYNYSEVGKNEVDRFVGAFDYNKTMMAKVEFLGNDLVAAFGDDKIVLYSIKQKPSVIAEIGVDNEIKSIFYCEDNFGFIVSNGEAEKPYTMIVYDTKGKKVSEIKFNLLYKDIKISDGNIVIYNDVTMVVYTVDGKEKYRGDFQEGITSVVMLDNDYNYIVITPSEIKTIKLK